MIASILAAIVAVFGAIPSILKLFTKPSEQTSEDNKAAINQEESNFQNTGRPTE